MLTRLIMVLSADGVTARDSSHNPVSWTSKEDQELFKQTTKEFSVMIMGQKTFDAIGFPLPGRLTIVLTEESRTDQPGKLEHKRGDLKNILDELESRGFTKCCICGGTFVNSKFLEAGLINEVQLTIEPRLFGSGLRLFDKLSVDLSMELVEMKKLNESTVYLLYKIQKS